jgi:C4-dicarboxylate transporter DctM subunit
MSPTLVGIFGLLALFLLIFSRMPVGFVMILVGFTGFAALVNLSAAMSLMARDLYDVFGSYNLTVIPLFILMGQIAFHAGISGRLFDAAYKFLGHWPGGLAIATIGACTGFAAICGSTNATAATMAAVTLPEMKRYQLQRYAGYRSRCRRRQPGDPDPPQCDFHHLRHHDRAVHRETVHGRYPPGILLTLLFVITIVIWASLNPAWPPGRHGPAWQSG